MTLQQWQMVGMLLVGLTIKGQCDPQGAVVYKEIPLKAVVARGPSFPFCLCELIPMLQLNIKEKASEELYLCLVGSLSGTEENNCQSITKPH